MIEALYRLLTYGLYPFYYGLFFPRRLYSGKEDPLRFREKFGYTTLKRPAGKLIWFHAASVGESLSMLELVRKILVDNKNVNVLVTSATRTAAEMIEKRFPKKVIHQYAPLDFPHSVKRFLKTWKPDGCIWVESEIWPNLIFAAKATNVPLILLNMRVSDRSLKRWRLFKKTFLKLLNCFKLILTQTQRLAGNLLESGVAHVKHVGNLKYVSSVPDYDQGFRDEMRAVLSLKKYWFVASTHPGEEEIISSVHLKLLETIPEVKLLLAPRHPYRSQEIELKFKDLGLKSLKLSELRSYLGDRQKLFESIDMHSVILIDEMGVLPVFYDIAAFTVVGGSLVPKIGGHNMIEPIRQKSVPIFGPFYHNFVEVAESMLADTVGIRVQDAESLKKIVENCLTIKGYLRDFQENQKPYIQRHQKILALVYREIASHMPFLKAEERHKDSTLCSKIVSLDRSAQE